MAPFFLQCRSSCQGGNKSVMQLLIFAVALYGPFLANADEYVKTPERIVFQTTLGDLEFALWPEVAPVTAAHILKLAQLGAYNTVNFFRVDKGFVAQTSDVVGGRQHPLDERQQADATKTVPLEVSKTVKHSRRGLLSMARHTDPHSGGSSFSVMLGPAPHLDTQYTVFGEVTAGMDTLDRFEKVEVKREGIFVMPLERITIMSSYVYTPEENLETKSSCQEKLQDLRERFHAQAHTLEQIRSSKLPGNH